MLEFRLYDVQSKQIIEAFSDVEEARRTRNSLDVTQRRRIRVQKVEIPDPPMPELEACRKKTASAVRHLDLRSEHFTNLAWSHGIGEKTVDEALGRIAKRLRLGPWNYADYRRTRRRYRAIATQDAQAPLITCDAPEVAVVRVLAQTYPYNQFSVTPRGDVFVGHQYGYHPEEVRLYVTTLSPILDEAADLILRQSLGGGGRLYVHETGIERAADGSLLARLALIPAL